MPVEDAGEGTVATDGEGDSGSEGEGDYEGDSESGSEVRGVLTAKTLLRYEAWSLWCVYGLLPFVEVLVLVLVVLVVLVAAAGAGLLIYMSMWWS